MRKLELQVNVKKFNESKGMTILKCNNYQDKFLNRAITVFSKNEKFADVEYGDTIIIERQLSAFSEDGATMFYDGDVKVRKMDLSDILFSMIEQDNKLTKSEFLALKDITKNDIVEFFTVNTDEFIMEELKECYSNSKITYLTYKSFEILEVFKISKVLISHGIESKFAPKIYETLGRESYNLITDNILFALRVVPLDVLTNSLSTINASGDIYIKYLDFLNAGQAYVRGEDLTLNKFDLNSHPMLININGYYVDKYLYQKESFIYNYLNKIKETTHFVDKYSYMELSDEQNKAVNNSLKNNLSIITGGPGTGKTTTIVKLIQSLEEEFAFKDLKVLASTGSAADVLTTKIHGHEAKTLHSYVEGLKRGQTPAPIIIIDESSMLDVNITYTFLKLISKYDISHLIFVGDEDQLPSVEYGYVLTNGLKMNYNVAKLTKTFRQG